MSPEAARPEEPALRRSAQAWRRGCHFEVIVGELRQAAEQAAVGAEQQPLSRAELLARRAARGS
jgi:hypothetical protein